MPHDVEIEFIPINQGQIKVGSNDTLFIPQWASEDFAQWRNDGTSTAGPYLVLLSTARRAVQCRWIIRGEIRAPVILVCCIVSVCWGRRAAARE